MTQKGHLKPYLSVFFALAFCCAGFVLRGAPSDPDVEFTKLQELGLFLIFVWFCISTVEWGRSILYILNLSELGLFGSLATGTAWLSILGLVLGHSGLIGFPYFPLVFAIIFMGPVISGWYKKRSNFNLSGPTTFSQLSRDPIQIILFGIVLITFVSLLVNASLAHGTSDPFLYHLLGPRFWVDHGQIFLPTQIPIVFQSSTWEMIILISQNLLGGPNGLGLIEGHIFAQYLHIGFGVGGCLIALWFLLKDLKLPQYWTWVALLAALLSPGLRMYSWLGKNDWGVLFWVISGSILLLSHARGTRREMCLGGVLIGLGVIAKPNSSFFSIGVLLFAAFQILRKFELKESMARLLLLGACVLGAMIPIMLRNWVYTDCPLFPFIYKWINREILSLQEIDYFNKFPVVWHFSISYFKQQINWIREDHLANIFIFIVPFLSFLFRSSTIRKLAWIVPLSTLWIMSAEIVNPFIRWIGAPLIFSGVFLILCIAEILNRIPMIERLKAAQGVLCLGLSAYLFVNVSVRDFWTVLDDPSPSYVIRTPTIHMGGDAKAWLRMNANFTTPIFSTGDDQFYYLASLPVTSSRDDPKISRIVEHISTSESIIDRLYNLGYRYALDVTYWEQRYWTYQALLVDRAAFKYPESIVYIGKNSEVIDLKILEESMTQSCVKVRAGGISWDQLA